MNAEEADGTTGPSDGVDGSVDEREAGRAATGVTTAALARIRTVRGDTNHRRAALAVAAMAGILSASVHWLGLFLAGALVGLVSADVPRALAAGLLVGVLVLVVHVGGSPVMGVGEFLALSPASAVTVGAALVAPAWGALVRAVV